MVDFEKCYKTHIYLQKSEPIQPKTSNILPKICRSAVVSPTGAERSVEDEAALEAWAQSVGANSLVAESAGLSERADAGCRMPDGLRPCRAAAVSAKKKGASTRRMQRPPELVPIFTDP